MMIGSVVGNYKIIDKIGEGGMGAVFKGVDLMLEREVAIKMLRPELARQPVVVERFRTEAVTLAKLNHSNVATLHSFFRQGDDFFMVMEFVRGKTLDDLITAEGAMQSDSAIELFCMALEGIDHAHKMGIVHRDIKPANMMLTETGSIKVMDFGIARVLGTDRLTKTGHLIGTVEYMSPEQVRGEETDARSDIYSLGILLYEMLTGRVPFNSKSEYELMRCQIEEAPTPPRVLAPHIPLAVEQAIMCALAKNPDARYQSASEFREMLIQKTTGSITRVDVSPASYTTRESESIAGALSSGPVIKETRLPSGPGAPSSGPVIKETRLASDLGVPAALAGQLKETRVAATVGLPIGYQDTSPQHYAPQPQASGSLASMLGKLNWKHYGTAAVVLIALITVPLVLIGGGDKSPATQPPAAAQPSPTSPETPPAQSATPDPNQPSVQPGATSVPVQPDGQGVNASKPTPSSSAGGQTATQPRTPAQTRASSGSRGDGTTAARRAEKGGAKKSKVDKVGEAAQAVGGAVKKFGGLFKKKRP